MRTNSKSLKVVAVIVILLFVFGLGWLLAKSSGSSGHGSKGVAKKPLYWVAPMNPNYRSDKPGKSPMGMDLVPVYDEPSKAGSIKIASNVVNNLGVRTAHVKKMAIGREIKAVGYVHADESSVETVRVYTPGWIEGLTVNSTGEQVEKDQVLFKLYSPNLVSAQEEYLLALKHDNRLLTNAGKQKLMTLGMSAGDIKQLRRSNKAFRYVPVYSPMNGYVTKLSVRDGAHIAASNFIMSIADLSKIWIISEVPEAQASWLKVGQHVMARVSSHPGKVLHGHVDYIYPELNHKTRTVRVRLIFSNKDNVIKPGMFAKATIHVDKSQPALVIPKESVIQLGDQNRVVISLGDGRFKSVNIELGEQNKDWVVVTKGLHVGQRVVTSAQFLIDSESSLKTGLKRISSQPSEESQDKTEVDHSAMNH